MRRPAKPNLRFAENVAIGKDQPDTGKGVTTKPFEMSSLGNEVRRLLKGGNLCL